MRPICALNFRKDPEKQAFLRFGYSCVSGVMLIVALLMFRSFKKRSGFSNVKFIALD